MGAGFLSWIRGTEKEIISILEQQSATLVKAAGELAELMFKFDNVQERKARIKDIEHEGDQLTHTLYTILDRTFVTPLDREDLSSLTGEVDEIIDYIDGTAARVVMFKVGQPTPYMVELAKILVSATQEVHLLMSRLKHFKSSQDLIEHCRNISRYEHEADEVYRAAIAELFESKDAIEIIKMKDIYETQEEALDLCADVADTFEDIALKYG